MTKKHTLMSAISRKEMSKTVPKVRPTLRFSSLTISCRRKKNAKDTGRIF